MKFVIAYFTTAVLIALGILLSVEGAEGVAPDPLKTYTIHKSVNWCENVNPKEELTFRRGSTIYNWLNRNRDRREVRLLAHQYKNNEVARTFFVVCER